MVSPNERAAHPDPIQSGATAVITHLVLPGHEGDYERWIDAIRPVVLLEGCVGSRERNELIERVRPILEAEDQFHIRSGLDFWFVPEEARAKVPVRWKQAHVTSSAIYTTIQRRLSRGSFDLTQHVGDLKIEQNDE